MKFISYIYFVILLFLLSGCFISDIVGEKNKLIRPPTADDLDSKDLRLKKSYPSQNLDLIKRDANNIDLVSENKIANMQKKSKFFKKYIENYDAISIMDPSLVDDNVSDNKSMKDIVYDVNYKMENIQKKVPRDNILLSRKMHIDNKVPIPEYLFEYIDYNNDETIEKTKDFTFLEQKHFAIKGTPEQRRNIRVAKNLNAANFYKSFNSNKFTEEKL